MLTLEMTKPILELVFSRSEASIMIEAKITRLSTPPVINRIQMSYHSTRSISLRVQSVLSTTNISSRVRRALLEQTERVLRKSRSISWNKVPTWSLAEITLPEFICMPILMLNIPQNKQIHVEY